MEDEELAEFAKGHRVFEAWCVIGSIVLAMLIIIGVAIWHM